MNNYIQIYKNAIDDEYCDELITKFNIDSKQETSIKVQCLSHKLISIKINGKVM